MSRDIETVDEALSQLSSSMSSTSRSHVWLCWSVAP